MQWIKLNRDCALGKKGQEVEVMDYIAKPRIEKGHATACDEPEWNKKRREECRKTEDEKRRDAEVNQKAVRGKKITRNKSLSA